MFDYLRRPAAADPAREGTPFQGLSRELRTELTPRQRQALRDQPSRLREMDGIIRDAAYHAAQFPLALQKLAYNRALLELQGAPVDQRLAGTEVEELAPIIENISKRESDPLDQLAKAVRQALPENEQRILSPRLGDSEISPDQIVKGPGGLYVVSYDSSGSTGLAPGWFTNEVVKAAFRESKDLEAERRLGGEERFTGLWAGSTRAARPGHRPRGGERGPSARISMNYSATSIQATQGGGRREPGEHDRGVHAGDDQLRTDAAQGSVISESFGKKEVPDVSNNYHSDSAGWTTNVSSKEVPMVPQDRVRNLKPGEVILTDSSSESRRDNIVQTFPFYEANNPVGATMDYVRAATVRTCRGRRCCRRRGGVWTPNGRPRRRSSAAAAGRAASPRRPAHAGGGPTVSDRGAGPGRRSGGAVARPPRAGGRGGRRSSDGRSRSGAGAGDHPGACACAAATAGAGAGA